MPKKQLLSGSELAERYEQDVLQGMSDEELEQRYGKPPHWFVEPRVPRYSEFRVDWRDATGREYMFIEPTQLGVRIPIALNRARNIEFPQLGETLVLTEIGGGQQQHISVLSSAGSTRENSVQILEIERLEL